MEAKGGRPPPPIPCPSAPSPKSPHPFHARLGRNLLSAPPTPTHPKSALQVTETGLGPHGIDTLRASEANMYQSIQRVEMGRRPPPQVDRVLRSPTRSSGYLRSREPGFNEHDGATMSFYGQ